MDVMISSCMPAQFSVLLLVHVRLRSPDSRSSSREDNVTPAHSLQIRLEIDIWKGGLGGVNCEAIG
jgi:hypothetical protein